MRGRKNSIQDACIQFKMPCYRKSHIRLKEVSNSTIRLVASNKRNKQAKYDLFCIWKGSCKDVIPQIQQAPEQEYLLPNSPVFLFTCFSFWKQKVFKISFRDQCLSNAVIYNSEKEETFFSKNEMPGECFILGIMMECCRYFYGAMMPDCNFQSQWQQNKYMVTVC